MAHVVVGITQTLGDRQGEIAGQGHRAFRDACALSRGEHHSIPSVLTEGNRGQMFELHGHPSHWWYDRPGPACWLKDEASLHRLESGHPSVARPSSNLRAVGTGR